MEEVVQKNTVIRKKEIKNKIINCFKKYNLILEFIFAIILVYSTYKIVFYKEYYDVFSLKHIIIFGITAISTTGIIIYNCIKAKECVHKIFICFLIPVSLLYVFFMAPTYVPDEHAHIWRAYEISEGKFIHPIKEDTIVPNFFINNSIIKKGKYIEFENSITENTNYNNDTTNAQNPAQSYPFTLYIFGAIAFAISRIFNINGIIAIYLARIFNLIFFIIIGYNAIKITPFGKKVFGIILFLPMVLQQAASISADSVINSISIFYVAYTMYLVMEKKQLKKRDKIFYIILSVLISISKDVYAPLVGLVLLFLNRKKEKKIIGFIISTIVISALFCVGSFIFTRQYESIDIHKQYMETYNVNATEQIKTMIKSPSIFGIALKNDIFNGCYIGNIIGSNLGWLNIGNPSIVIYGFLILLTLSPFLDNNKKVLNKKERIWSLLMAVAVYLLISVGMYVTWTGVGEYIIRGIQGRYFIPIVPLILIVLCNKEKYITDSKKINIAISFLAAFLNCITIYGVIKFFV